MVVPGDETVARDALRLQMAGAESLRKDPRLELVEFDLSPQAGVKADRHGVKADKILADVDARVADLDYEAARARAEAGLLELRGADFRAVRAQFTRLLVQLARIKFALKAEDPGTAELSQAFVLDPSLQPPRDLNSRERLWFEEVKRTVEAAPKSPALALESAGGNGLVWLDGRFIGVTPVSVERVTAGRHFLTFEAPGLEPQHTTELLGKVTRVELGAAPSPEGKKYLALLASLAAGFRNGAPGPGALELLARARCDEVIAVFLDGAGARLTASVLRTAARGSVASPPIALSSAESEQASAVVDAVLGAVDLALVPVPGQAAVATGRPTAAPPPSAAAAPLVAPSPAAAPPAAAPPAAARTVALDSKEPPQANAKVGRSKAPAVVLIVAAVATAGAGVGLLFGGQAKYAEARRVPQVDDATYEATVSQGEAFTAGAIVSFGVGVAAAAVGIGVAVAW